MKRALTVLPLVALAVGVALFLFRSAPRSQPAPTTAPALAGAVGHPPSPAPAGAPSLPAPASPGEADGGAIRFILTMRGQPAPGALITVRKSGTSEFRKFGSEADGTQLLQGLPFARYDINIEFEDAIVYNGDVLIDSRELRLVAIELKVGGRISGTVTDRSGHPIGETRVFLVDQRSRGPAAHDAVTTGPDGRYALKGVAAGLYQVRFRHAVYQPLDRSDIELHGADDHREVDAVLAIGARLSGRVVDDSGAPIGGADLVAGNGSSGGTAQSAADGTFTISGLTEIPANISAAKPGYGKVVLRNAPVNSNNLLFRLPKAGILSARLLIDTVPRKIQVVLSRYDEELRQVIPAESQMIIPSTAGTFEARNIPPGTYWIEVQADGYELVDRPQVGILPGETTPELSIAMRKKN